MNWKSSGKMKYKSDLSFLDACEIYARELANLFLSSVQFLVSSQQPNALCNNGNAGKI